VLRQSGETVPARVPDSFPVSPTCAEVTLAAQAALVFNYGPAWVRDGQEGAERQGFRPNARVWPYSEYQRLPLLVPYSESPEYHLLKATSISITMGNIKMIETIWPKPQ